MSQSSTVLTLTQISISNQIQHIYQMLCKLGYPKLVKLKLQQHPKQLLEIYFQPTPSRQHLIQWLISQAYPLYMSEVQFLPPLSLTLPTNRTAMLWRLGLMPFSKHTKSMDYLSYVDGLLGYQNAVKLIYDLVNFVNIDISIESTKPQNINEDNDTFNSCLKDIIYNFEYLVNANYDPYGVTFPQAFKDYDINYINDKYASIQNKTQNLNIQQPYQNYQNNFQKLFEQMEINKKQFGQKMAEFIKRVNQLSEKYPQYQIMQLNQQNNDQLIKGRTINVSTELCEKMRELKQIRKIKKLNQNISLKPIINQIKSTINSLNQNIDI